jgi:hypothetical protein
VGIAENLDSGQKPGEGSALPVAVGHRAGNRGERHDPGHQGRDSKMDASPEQRTHTSGFA